MKKISTLLVTAVLAHMATAQTQLPNSTFESWGTDANNRDSLAGWSSSNSVVMYPVRSLYKETDAYQGSFAAKVVTAPFGFVQYTTIGMLVNGAATFTYGGGGGGANVAYESGGGTPISIKPSELRGHYKYETSAATDHGLAHVLLTRYNTTTNRRDTVSIAHYTFAAPASYTAFTIPLPDLMPGTTPDTITTIFSASDPATVPNNSVFSSLFLDSISLYKAPAVPDADFSADSVTGTINTTVVHLTDLSTNTPDAWTWTFTPNTVAYQSATTAASQNPIVKFTAAGSYTVKLRVSNPDGSDSVTKTAYILISDVPPPTGIRENRLDNPHAIYPNPANDRLYFDPALLGGTVRINDISGRTLISTSKLQSNGIDVTALQNGLYFISVTKEEQVYTHKLQIMR